MAADRTGEKTRVASAGAEHAGRDRRALAVLAVALIAVLFVSVNILADASLRGFRIDLTEDRLYTLSDGTREILGDLDAPVALTLYYSESLAAGRPQVQAYAARVRELLETYESVSRGMVDVVVRDPEPFSEAEEDAQRAGLTGQRVDALGQRFYFGLVATNDTDGRAVIPFLDPQQERLLEYELTRLVDQLANPARGVVALSTSLPMDGSPANPMARQPDSPPWAIVQELRRRYDVRFIGEDFAEVGDDVDVLIVAHAKNLTGDALRAIDRHARSGRGTILVVDPVADADIPPGAQQNPRALFGADRSSDLDDVLGAWGVSMDDERVVIDARLAMSGPAADGADVPYPHFLRVGPGSLNADDPLTSPLREMLLVKAGELTFDPSVAPGVVFEPLIESSASVADVQAARVAVMPQPRRLMADIPDGVEPKVLAARLTGSPPAAPVRVDSDEAPPPDDGGLNVVVLADADVLADRTWVQEQRFGNVSLGFSVFSDNGNFILTAVDQLAGSTALVSLRARGAFQRPFTRVEEIRRAAEREYLDQAEALEERRREVERRLVELQQARPDAGGVLLTDEQRAEIDRFQDELAETNRQLRQVRFNLRKDVEDLGLTLKIVNIGLAPALVALAAIALALVRAARRRADRRHMAALA